MTLFSITLCIDYFCVVRKYQTKEGLVLAASLRVQSMKVRKTWHQEGKTVDLTASSVRSREMDADVQLTFSF